MSVRRRSITTRLTEELRSEKGSHAITRGLFDVRGKALEIADRQIGELRRENAQLRNDLTACQLERDQLKGRCTALAILLYGQPEDPEAAKVLNASLPELMRRTEPRPCTHDDPSWCDAECERWREWVKARDASKPHPEKL